MEFYIGLGIVVVLALLILVPTKVRKMRKKPEDDLDRFFEEKKEE
ncbi:hypothetical protein [Proteiniclasticum ruminis]|nr:hypothetical protein [Proteiniclasticum ruminis]